MIAKVVLKIHNIQSGYIAGDGDGIVTLQGKPAARKIWLLNSVTLAVEQSISSLKNGHYAFFGLDLDERYLVMVRDYKQEFEPFAWDYVKPADDLTIDEQQTMWVGFQPK